MMSSSKPAYVFAETPPYEKQFLSNYFDSAGKEVFFADQNAQDLTPNLSEARVLSVFIKSKVDQALIQKMPSVKLITTRSTGFDHIDLKACQARGIAVANVPAYGENTVAEHAFALILSLSRNLRRAYLQTLNNNFSLDGLMGFDLKGKTLGVIGTGRIGLHVIRIGLGFGMRVIASDVKEQTFLSEVMGFTYLPMDEVLGQSDVLSLHTPFIPETRHLINEAALRKVKRGALLINTSRGGLIDTHALVKALDGGVLSGVGLDVLEEEEFLLEEKRLRQKDPRHEAHWNKLKTNLENHELLSRENVIYTPHMAFYSREAVQRILETTIKNIQAFEDGKTLNRVS